MGSGFYSIIFSTLFYSSFLLYRLFLKLQIAGQNQVQLRGRFCHKAAALVEDGLFQRVAGKTEGSERGRKNSHPALHALLRREDHRQHGRHERCRGVR